MNLGTARAIILFPDPQLPGPRPNAMLRLIPRSTLLRSSPVVPLSPLRRAVTRCHSVAPIAAGKLDHVCVCVRNVEESIRWYRSVLGFELRHAGSENFWPSDPRSPAFLASADGAAIALLPLGPTTPPIADHRGAHLALNVTRTEWDRARTALPALLETHRVHEAQSLAVEEADYGLQRSLFFSDPDNNILELTTWDV